MSARDACIVDICGGTSGDFRSVQVGIARTLQRNWVSEYQDQQG